MPPRKTTTMKQSNCRQQSGVCHNHKPTTIQSLAAGSSNDIKLKEKYIRRLHMANTNCFFAFCSLHPAVSIQLLLRCGESMDGASQRGGRAPRGRTAAYLCPPPSWEKLSLPSRPFPSILTTASLCKNPQNLSKHYIVNVGFLFISGR